MATAKFTPGECVETTPATVTVTLSIAEAQVLLDVGAKIGGNYSTTRRRHFDSVTGAIRAATDYRVSGGGEAAEKTGLKIPWGAMDDISGGLSFIRNDPTAYKKGC